MTFRRRLKQISLAIILAVGAYALMPPREEPSAPEDHADEGRDREVPTEVRYELKFAPGPTYLPGTQPYGLGKTIDGIDRVIERFRRIRPDTSIEVLTVPGTREYLVTQLSSGQAPDIINVNVEDVWVDVQKDWYVPLDTFLESPNPFVLEKGDPELPGAQAWWDMFKYQAISRGKAAPDNRNYCISFDMVETGLYYNKDVFERLGLEVPGNWEEFLQVMETIRSTPGPEGRPMTPLALNIFALNDWGVDLIFDQLYYDLLPGIDLFQDPVREQYLEGYLDPDELVFLHRKGFFTARDPRYRQLWQIMRELRQYTNQDLASVDMIREFVNQNAAMIWSGSWLTYRFSQDRDLGFDWGVFYLPQFTLRTSEYASGEPMCVIGGAATQLEITNSAVRDTDPSLPMDERMRQSERLKRVVEFLQFLCLPENCDTIVNEYSCFLPNIVGVEVQPELEPFARILERRYTTTKWIFSFDLRFSEIQQRMLELYLSDQGGDLDEFLAWQERNLEAAAGNFLKRKKDEFDEEKLEAAWQAKASLRAGMKDMPPYAPAAAGAAESE